MSFIELTLSDSEGITINTDFVGTIRTKVLGARYEGDPGARVVTEIMLIGPLPAHAHIQVTESYEEIRKLIGMEEES